MLERGYMLIALGCRHSIPVILYGRAAGYFWTAEQYDTNTGSENIMLRVFAPRLIARGPSRGRRNDHVAEWYAVDPYAAGAGHISLYTSEPTVRACRTMAQHWFEVSLATAADTRYAGRPLFELENLRWKFDVGFRSRQCRETVSWARVCIVIPFAAEHLCKQMRKLEEAWC